MRAIGYISAMDTIRLLQQGIPVYIVSAPYESRVLPLDGAWVDDDGKVHLDCSAVVLNPEVANAIGRKYNQECILRLYPTYFAKNGVFLLQDTPFTRKIALDYAGGYTADGEWLFTAVKDIYTLPLEEEYEEYVPVDIDFLPVK
jgi:hypothetical protein